MQRLAKLVEARETTLDRMGVEHGPALARAIAEDDDFDPNPPTLGR